MDYRGKVFTSYDNKIVTLVTDVWTNKHGQTFIRLGNGDKWLKEDFDCVFLEA